MKQSCKYYGILILLPAAPQSRSEEVTDQGRVCRKTKWKEDTTMKTMTELLEQVKKHPDYHKAGMILCHNGVVRETSRDGREVRGLSVSVDRDRLTEIIAFQKKRQGIVEILVSINEGENLAVGDDVMFLVVAGDIRETVIEVLSDTLNQIKATVTSKTEFFID
jgi:molybdopterin synthase catalytic subunit